MDETRKGTSGEKRKNWWLNSLSESSICLPIQNAESAEWVFTDREQVEQQCQTTLQVTAGCRCVNSVCLSPWCVSGLSLLQSNSYDTKLCTVCVQHDVHCVQHMVHRAEMAGDKCGLHSCFKGQQLSFVLCPNTKEPKYTPSGHFNRDNSTIL